MGSCCSRVSKNKLVADEGVSHNNAKQPTSPSQVTLADKTHERCLNKEKMYKNEVKRLEKQRMDLEKLTKDKDKEIITLKENHYQQMEEQILKHEYERKALDKKISKQREQIRELREENDTLLTRFSAVASAKLTDGNPNIADLSDENRPTKLAEQYSELYDNEWTDAFGVFNGRKPEENACRILLDMFCDIYRACIKIAKQDRDNVTDAIKIFLDGQQPPVELLKQLKDERKKKTAGQKTIIKQEIKGKIKCILPEKELRKDQHVKRFMNKCIGLCWRMAVQDPPVHVDVNIDRCDELHDSTLYKPYTKSGIYIDYIVWPVLYLYENGNILMKGIAQCKAKNSKHSSVHSLTSTKPTTGMGYNNHSNKDYGTFNNSGASSTLIAAPDSDVLAITVEHEEKRNGNQVLHSSLNSVNKDTLSNTRRQKKTSLTGKIARQNNLENTSKNCLPHQISPEEAKENYDNEETLKSANKHQDCPISDDAMIAEDDRSNDREIPNKNSLGKNEINRVTTPSHIQVQLRNKIKKNRSSTVKF